jgi:hypothetical protein
MRFFLTPRLTLAQKGAKNFPTRCLGVAALFLIFFELLKKKL